METELEKWQRWYTGMERAKKMWFRKYCEVREQRDEALAELQRPNKLLHLTALRGFLRRLLAKIGGR